MCEDYHDKIARALFKAFEEHVTVPPELELRLLNRFRMASREIEDDLPGRLVYVTAPPRESK